MKTFYSIGNHLMSTEGDRLCAMLASMPSFEVFRTEAVTAEGDFSFVETTHEPPAFEQVIYQLRDLDTSFLFGHTAGGYRMQQIQDNGRQMNLWVPFGGRQMLISGDWELMMLRSFLWTGYGIQTVGSGTIAIHSSCIVCHGQAVLCLGESGTGKSTHTRLWRQHIDGSHLLNDDSPLLRVEEGEVWVYGSPWSGKTPCYRPERFPLKACIRLSQAPQNAIRRLSVLQAYAALHPSCPPAFAYDRQLYDSISQTLSRLLESVPCYHLACLPDEAAARLSHQTLFVE